MRIKTHLLAWILFLNTGLAQDYPKLKSVMILATISFERSDSMFYYDYVLKNSSESKGSIIRFEIDISRLPNSIMLDTVGLKFGGSELMEHWFREDYRHLQEKIVPVSFFKTPGRWTGSFSNNLTAEWNGYPLVRPGSAISGYTLTSRGLPGIRRWIASPRFDVDSLFPDIEDTTANMSISQMDSIREVVNYRGWTIGPTAPPISFIQTVWCDTLLSYVHQSISLGWIKDRHVEQRLDQKLEMAKRLLQMADTWPPGSSAFLDETEKALKEDDNECSREYGQDAVREVPRLMLDEEKLRDLIRIGRESMQGSGRDKMKKPDENQRKEQYRDALYWAAKQVMESFVREVEILNKLSEKGLPAAAGKRQYLTSEAYALLKYNAEYLIDQLPEKKKK
jgi:hypothetical protein